MKYTSKRARVPIFVSLNLFYRIVSRKFLYMTVHLVCIDNVVVNLIVAHPQSFLSLNRRLKSTRISQIVALIYFLWKFPECLVDNEGDGKENRQLLIAALCVFVIIKFRNKRSQPSKEKIISPSDFVYHAYIALITHESSWTVDPRVVILTKKKKEFRVDAIKLFLCKKMQFVGCILNSLCYIWPTGDWTILFFLYTKPFQKVPIHKTSLCIYTKVIFSMTALVASDHFFFIYSQLSMEEAIPDRLQRVPRQTKAL